MNMRSISGRGQFCYWTFCDTELGMRGDALPRPVNYSLLRVVPPAGVQVDRRKRPVVVIDPRAGQGPGQIASQSQIPVASRTNSPIWAGNM
jgi:Protein of unknown function (DUF3141)